MGSGEVNAAVADAGPIIHLGEIGCLFVLKVFGVVHIPNSVWEETVGRERVQETDVSSLNNVRMHTVSPAYLSQFVRDNNLGGLQAGEVECLCLCREMNVAVLLTDDLAVRETAHRLNLTPVGSLGIVVRAYRAGLLSRSDAEHYLAELYEVSSLFVTQAIVEMAIQQLRIQSGQS